VTVVKAFVHQNPQTDVQITEAGRAAFEEHRAALQAIVENS
jgi:Winged helix DNA-binding domain